MSLIIDENGNIKEVNENFSQQTIYDIKTIYYLNPLKVDFLKEYFNLTFKNAEDEKEKKFILSKIEEILKINEPNWETLHYLNYDKTRLEFYNYYLEKKKEILC